VFRESTFSGARGIRKKINRRAVSLWIDLRAQEVKAPHV
jgi:hypothetical protein